MDKKQPQNQVYFLSPIEYIILKQANFSSLEVFNA